MGDYLITYTGRFIIDKLWFYTNLGNIEWKIEIEKGNHKLVNGNWRRFVKSWYIVQQNMTAIVFKVLGTRELK